MKVLYLECSAGVSGDMLMGALADVIGREEALQTLNSIGIDGVSIEAVRGEKSHIGGTKTRVLIHGKEEAEHHSPHNEHRKLSEVIAVIDGLRVSEKVKEHARAIYTEIAEAESTVPKPVRRGDEKIMSGPIFSMSRQFPTTSAIASSIPTSWKWTMPTSSPWTLDSASAISV